MLHKPRPVAVHVHVCILTPQMESMAQMPRSARTRRMALRKTDGVADVDALVEVRPALLAEARAIVEQQRSSIPPPGAAAA